MARLEITSGAAAGKSFDIGRALILGRQKGVDVLIDDIGASREHCKVFLQGGEVWVIDLNSRNGTKVNGVSAARQRLFDGDVIGIGTTTLRVVAPEAPPPVRAGAGAAAGRPATPGPSSPAIRAALAGSSPAASKGGAAPAGTAARGPSVMERERERLRGAAQAKQRSGGSPAAPADDGSGVVVREKALQFGRVENRTGLVHEDVGQRGGLFRVILAVLGLALVAGIAWGIVVATSGAPAEEEDAPAATPDDREGATPR